MVAETSLSPDPRSDPALSLESLRRIDLVCGRFEEAWQSGAPSSLEEGLAGAPAAGLEQSALLRELLALELEYRLRRGEELAIEPYLQRFPAHALLIDLVFREARASLASAPAFLVDHPRYRVLRLLGSGGMGTVYCAEHRVLQRPVALKVINPELLADAAAVERFMREARAAACLNHPNVVAVHDAETAGEGHFLVMEFVAGTDLAQVVRREGPLPVGRACDYIRQAAAGLQHAHEHGMVHRDITPRNLMVADEGQIKVLDFGLAQFVREARSRDPSGAPAALLGSVDFMAPEQAVDPQSADVRADVYGLGCTLWFLLTGRAPFPAATLREKLEAHARQPPPAVESLRGDVPAELSQVIGRMLAKSPADRYQTPREVAAALAPFATSTGAGGGAAPRGRRAWLLAAAGGAACALILAGGWYARWWPWARTTAEPRESTKASRLYQEGLLLLAQRQEKQWRLAIERFEGAVRADAAFTPAQTALADAYNICGDYGWEMADDVFPKAKQAARKALAIDERRAEAHLAMAFALEAYDCDWKGAEAEYLRALKLAPDLPAAHHWYAWFLVQQGQPDKATVHIEEAQRLDPKEIIIVNNVGKIYYLRRRYAQAVERHKYALVLNPDFRKAHRDLGLVYAEMGRLDDALREFGRAKGLTEDGRDLLSGRAYAYARNGHVDTAHRLLAELEPLAAKKPLAYEIATVYAALGEADRAFAWLRRACAEHSASRSGIAVDPRLDGIRRDRRFADLLKLLHLPTVTVK
jgi:tetratricopeptide (TPR) repeat protein